MAEETAPGFWPGVLLALAPGPTTAGFCLSLSLSSLQSISKSFHTSSLQTSDTTVQVGSGVFFLVQLRALSGPSHCIHLGSSPSAILRTDPIRSSSLESRRILPLACILQLTTLGAAV